MKYELTSETKMAGAVKLFRVKYIETGLLGGWIEKESNLSHYGNARVCGDASVSGDAIVHDKAIVYGDARVYGDAIVSKTGDLVCVSGLQYPITVTPQNCVIGCQLKTHAEWLSVTKVKASAMGLNKNQYQLIKSVLEPIFAKFAK